MAILKGPEGWPSVLLARAGTYDPDGGLADAERAGAWSTWKKLAPSTSPASIIRTIGESDLRGRGGAGYPTAEKWRKVAAAEADRRYVVANGYEADPGALLDRTLMETDPHAVVEGLAFAAFAVGATEAFLAVKAGYTVAVRRLRAAIRSAEEAGYIGQDALGAGFDLHLELREIQGAFVLGEETALLRAIENKRAQPDQRPPYPTERGLQGRPTVVNNVETLAAVPWIVANGGAAYQKLGMNGQAGTTLVQLGGALNRTGVAEVPMGVTLKEVLRGVGGGVPRGKLKALFVGGPSGGFLPPESLDTQLTPGSLAEMGAIMGSGSIARAGREHLPGGPRDADDALHERRSVRQDDPLPHRHAAPVRDRRALHHGPHPPRGPAADGRPLCRHARRRAVRPRDRLRPTRS